MNPTITPHGINGSSNAFVTTLKRIQCARDSCTKPPTIVGPVPDGRAGARPRRRGAAPLSVSSRLEVQELLLGNLPHIVVPFDQGSCRHVSPGWLHSHFLLPSRKISMTTSRPSASTGSTASEPIPTARSPKAHAVAPSSISIAATPPLAPNAPPAEAKPRRPGGKSAP